MECLTWFAPILPGQLEAYKEFAAEAFASRRQEYDQSRRRMGISREVVSHMPTPQGDFACVFQEGEDIGNAFRLLASSDHPYDEWFRGKLTEIHGITPEMLLQGPPPATVQVDYRANT
jgi:hypothetical protein